MKIQRYKTSYSLPERISTPLMIWRTDRARQATGFSKLRASTRRAKWIYNAGSIAIVITMFILCFIVK